MGKRQMMKNAYSALLVTVALICPLCNVYVYSATGKTDTKASKSETRVSAKQRAAGVKSVTYENLKGVIAGSRLSAGQKYRIVDYRTRHTIPNTSDVNLGPVEPLMVTAVSASKLSALAYSESYPQDIIHYEVTDSSTAGGDRGRIVYRKDTKWNISLHEDWRHVKYRRWETARGSGKYWLNRAPGLERKVVIGGGGDTIVLQHNLYYPIQTGDSFTFNGAQAKYTVTAIKDGEACGYPGLIALTVAGGNLPPVIPADDPQDFIEYTYRDKPAHKDMLILGSPDPGNDSIHSIEIGKTTLSPDQLCNSVILEAVRGALVYDVRCGSNFTGNTNVSNAMVYVTVDGYFVNNIFKLFAVRAGFNFMNNIITDNAKVSSSRVGTNFSGNILDYGTITYMSVIDDFAYNTLTGNLKTGPTELTGLNFGENVFNNHWHSSRFLESNVAGGEFNLNRIQNSVMSQNSIGPSFRNNWIHGDLKNCEIGPNITGVDFGSGHYDDKVLQSGRSNFHVDNDITGRTTLDISPNNARYAGIVNVISGNATENINKVLNAPGKFPVRIMPAAGLTLTITGTPYSGINADGQILLNGASRVLVGGKRDFIEFERTMITNSNGTFTVVRENSLRMGM